MTLIIPDKALFSKPKSIEIFLFLHKNICNFYIFKFLQINSSVDFEILVSSLMIEHFFILQSIRNFRIWMVQNKVSKSLG